jgi:hypothetical protein
MTLARDLKRLNPVPHHQQPYLASHQLVTWFSGGVAFQGSVNLIAPELSQATASAIVLSPLLFAIFSATWLVGGALSVVGVVRGIRKAEAVGMSLLAGGFGAYYSILTGTVPNGWLTGAFILALAIGCFRRARHVAVTGYVTLEMKRDG